MSGTDPTEPMDPIEAIFAYPDQPKRRRGDEVGAQRRRRRREPPGAAVARASVAGPAPLDETTGEPVPEPAVGEAVGRRLYGGAAGRHGGAGLVCGCLMVALRLWVQSRFPAMVWHAPLGLVVLAGVVLALAVAMASARHGGIAPFGVGVGAAIVLGAAEIAAPVGLAVAAASLSLPKREGG